MQHTTVYCSLSKVGTFLRDKEIKASKSTITLTQLSLSIKQIFSMKICLVLVYSIFSILSLTTALDTIEQIWLKPSPIANSGMILGSISVTVSKLIFI